MKINYERDLLFNFKLILKIILGHYLKIYKIIFDARNKNKNLLFSTDTDIVIEGFPRCANTFFVIAFKELSVSKLNIAHHVHLTCQIKAALKHKIPIIILIRHPIDCVLSLKIRDPRIGVNIALFWYYIFYKYVHVNRSNIYIKEFNSFTNDHSSIKIEILKFKDVNSLDASNIFNKIENFNKTNVHKNKNKSHTISKPNLEKEKIKDDLRQKMFNNSWLEKKCIQIYNKILLDNKSADA